jgi:ADP-ribose pyrophosphatase
MPLHRDPRIAILSSQSVFRGRVFEVVDEAIVLPSGLRQDLALVVHPGAVAIAAEDENGELVLVRQYRHALGRWLIELPAGRLEANEEPSAAARRELEEETGCAAREWSLLREFVPAPGFCSERIWIFHARGLAPVAQRRPHDADEEFELVRHTPEALLASECDDGKTLLAAALLLRLKARERGR